MSSGTRPLILELVGPNRRLDWDYANRCTRYIQMIKTALKADGRFKSCRGHIIADRIDEDPAPHDHLRGLQDRGIVVRRWSDLLDEAKAARDEYLHILASRGRGDPGLAKLVAGAAAHRSG